MKQVGAGYCPGANVRRAEIGSISVRELFDLVRLSVARKGGVAQFRISLGNRGVGVNQREARGYPRHSAQSHRGGCAHTVLMHSREETGVST